MARIFRRQPASALIGGVAIVGALMAGCAGSPDAAVDESMSSGDMGGMTMNDPDATPAGQLPGATEAAFALLDTRPPGTDGVRGTAWLALGEQAPGTTLTVTMSGLTPGAEFVGHLHSQPCAELHGGSHFKFDPGGSDMPPNEVHIGFTAAPDGTGSATVTNEQPATGAPSVVIHPVEAMDSRLACAEF